LTILRYLLPCLFILLGLQVEARHIIGGEVTYVCRGENIYDFTMRIYRDCAGNGACFDAQTNCQTGPPANAHVTFFNGTTILDVLFLNAPTVRSIEPNLSNPCLIAPPNVCVEEGVYTFSVQLPNTGNTITMAYQRCCRNVTINNIVNPEDVGATYLAEIFPVTQDSCNSSPTFNDFPPIVICQGEDVNFDHSATDPEGDSLVYAFCTPFNGGGNNFMGGPSVTDAPDGVTPNPETAPPYDPVRFLTGFSVESPLNISSNRDEPDITIDSETGLISGMGF